MVIKATGKKKNIGKNTGVWAGVAVLNRVFTDLSVKRHISRSLEEVRERALRISGGKAF